MNKLKLDVESLRVDTFAPEDDRRENPGTVHARQISNACNYDFVWQR